MNPKARILPFLCPGRFQGCGEIFRSISWPNVVARSAGAGGSDVVQGGFVSRGARHPHEFPIA